MLWHQKVPMRQLPVFPTLEDEDLILISRKSPRLEGLISAQTIADAGSTAGPPGPPGPQGEPGPPGSDATVTREAIISAGGLTTPESVSLGGNFSADSGKVLGFDAGGGITGSSAAAFTPAVHGVSTTGYGGLFESTAGGIGLKVTGTTAPALEVRSTTGSLIYLTDMSGQRFFSVDAATFDLHWRKVQSGFDQRLSAPDAPAGNRVWSLPDASGTIALTSDLAGIDTSITRFWACPVMQVDSPDHFPTMVNLSQVELIGAIQDILPDSTTDDQVAPYMPPRYERYPVWQSTDKEFTMWVTPGDFIVLYGRAVGFGNDWCAWRFEDVAAPAGSSKVLNLLDYELVTSSYLTWDAYILSWVESPSTGVGQANFHGPLFLDASFGGGGTADYGKASLYSDTGELIASATEGYAIQGRVWSGNPNHAAVYAEGSGATMGIMASSVDGFGANLQSHNSLAIRAISAGGTTVARFHDTWNATKTFSIERSGTLTWWFQTNNRFLNLVPPPTPSGNHTWNLPNAGGTIALTANQTFTTTILAGATTATGQVELTGQLATNPTSAMTRAIGDERYAAIDDLPPLPGLQTSDHSLFTSHLHWDVMGMSSGGTSGSGTSGVSDNAGLMISGSTVASAWQRGNITQMIFGSPGNTGEAGSAFYPFSVSINTMTYISNDEGWGIVYLIGDAGSGAPPVTGSPRLSARGFGLRLWYSVADSAVRYELFAHDGTTYRTSPSRLWTPVNGGGHPTNLILGKGSDGVIRMWRSGSDPLAPVPENAESSLAGGPVDGIYGGKYLSAYVQNSPVVPTAGAYVRIFSAHVRYGDPNPLPEGLTTLRNISFPCYAAHRGGATKTPHQGLVAMQAAVADGSKILEMDLQLLADGEVVIFHDNNELLLDGNRASDATFLALTTSQWKSRVTLNPKGYADWIASPLYGWEGETLYPATLQDVLATFGNQVIIHTEFKSAGCRPRTEALLAQYKIRKDMFMVSGGVARHADLVAMAAQGWPANEYNASSTTAVNNKALGINWTGHGWDQRSLIMAAKLAGAKVATWTVTRKFQADEAIAAGADMVMTDDPRYIGDHGGSYRRTTDPYGLGKTYDGHVVLDKNKNFVSDGALNIHSGTDGLETETLLGWACPLPNPSTWSMTFKLTITKIVNSSRFGAIWLCMTDIQYKDTYPSGKMFGYDLLVRADGRIHIYQYNGLTGNPDVVASGTALAMGQEVDVQIDVTPTTITLTRLDIALSVVCTNSANRGPYISARSSGADVRFRNFVIT